MKYELTEISISRLTELLAAKEISAAELTKSYLSRIAEKDAVIHAYLTVTAEEAEKQAAEIDRRRLHGEVLPPLAGIPLGIKDNICTKGIRTTCGSKMLADFVPAYDAFVVRKLKEAGAVLTGKQNMDEFGMGSDTSHSAFYKTCNPHDPGRIPGGSSGGGAAAVAARLAAGSIGSDTGGSVRLPAAICGTVGLKPTYGAVSRNGLVAFASSFDQIGVLARNAADARLLLEGIAGRDEMDATSVGLPSFSGEEGSLKGLRFALPEEYFTAACSGEVREAVLAAAGSLEKRGGTVEWVKLSAAGTDFAKAALSAYYIISSAEASSNLARFDGVRYGFRAEDYENLNDLYIRSRSEGFGAEVRRRIMLGTFVLSEGAYADYYQKAMQTKQAVSRVLQRILTDYACIITPASPVTAWKFGEKKTPTELYGVDFCTVPANLAGLPALSLPCGRDKNGLPIGIQLMGRPFAEEQLLAIAAALEEEGAR